MVKYNIRKGFCFFLTTVAVLAVQFLFYLLDSLALGIMDFGGWTFYLASCVSHAACLALPIFLIYSLLCIARVPRLAGGIQVLLAIVLSGLVFVNEQVYQIYRFHINGFVINMLTGPAAGEIFNFDLRLYAKYILFFIVIAVGYSFVWHMIVSDNQRIALLAKIRCKKLHVTVAVAIIAGCTLYAHVYHIFASFYQKTSVIISERLLPYYFPTTSYSMMTKLGFEPPVGSQMNLSVGEGNMQYPLQPLMFSDSITANPMNIVLILIDSWNPRSLTAECMPNVYDYARRNLWFKNHVSCSNGTKSSVFGIWYGISSYYWNMAEAGHITPAMLEVACKKGYSFRNYPSASQLDPPFAQVIFAKEKNVRYETRGATSLERDAMITDDFIHDISEESKRKEPFFAFVFYDGPHSFELPTGELRFNPSWTYANYSVLNNDTDPTPFWNLYRNTCFETDKCIGRLFKALEENGLSENTMVIITGDHSQEFNENHKNYWGHNGNFSLAQIGVPLIMHLPTFQISKEFFHRTTHYDISPTIMQMVFNVNNPESDYSMGHQLADTSDRNWHVVGSELNYGFIIHEDSILEKTPQGGLDVYDKNMNYVKDYRINGKDFNNAIQQLNRFMK